MSSLEQERSRGSQAKALLENPLIVEAFSVMDAEIMQAWENSPARDSEGRERLFQMLLLARRVKRHFESVVETGKMAERTLLQKVKFEQRL